MSTRFFTNDGDQTLLRKFRGIFENNPDIEWFDALVGYLRASGYFAVRPHLDNVPHIRILVGINVDAIMADYHRRSLLFLPDPTKALEEFKHDLQADIQSAAYKQEIEAGILQFVDDVISKKIELRAHPTKRLHAKLYIFRPKGFNEHKPGAVITGSSNLTGAGLGKDEGASNYEFNVLLHDYDDVHYATGEFERLWAESVEILPKFLAEVRDSTYLAATVTPYELYFKLLLEYFGASIEYDPNALTDMPEGFKRLSYQVDAVTSGFRLLEKHGGFFLADAHPYHLAMGFMLQRYCGYLNHINRTGDIMAESRGGHEDRLLMDSYSRVHAQGVWMSNVTTFQHALTSKQLKVKNKSANIAGLQLADILGHPVRQAILREEGQVSEPPAPFASRLMPIVQSKYNHHLYSGKIEGYGKVFFPK